MLDLQLVEEMLEPVGANDILTVAEFVDIKTVPIGLGQFKLFVMDLGYANTDNPDSTGPASAFEREYFAVVTGIRFVDGQHGNQLLRQYRLAVRKTLFGKTLDPEYAPIGLAGGKQLAIEDKKLFYLDRFITSHEEVEE